MSRNSEQRGACTLLGFCKAWQSYVGWWEVLERQVGESSDVKRDSAHATVQRIANAFSALVENEKTRLADLLKRSDQQLHPLSDPFRLPLLGHRWLDLRREREESYSDWLAWLLGQMDAERVLRVFGLEQTDFGRFVRSEKPRVYREEGFRSPTGELKRLDIVVRFGRDVGMLLVEVKIRELELAGGAENLPTYRS